MAETNGNGSVKLPSWAIQVLLGVFLTATIAGIINLQSRQGLTSQQVAVNSKRLDIIEENMREIRASLVRIEEKINRP